MIFALRPPSFGTVYPLTSTVRGLTIADRPEDSNFACPSLADTAQAAAGSATALVGLILLGTNSINGACGTV
jgi:hypothetical protein